MYVNTGKLQDANAVFDALLKEQPNLLGALLGRGSAWALMASEASSSAVNSSGPGASTAEKMAREAYMRALKDFSLAITHHPNVADCYKRRGQVLCALGGHVNNEDAVTDMTCAIKLDREQSGEDLSKRDPDALQQRGQVYQRQKNYKRRSEISERP